MLPIKLWNVDRWEAWILAHPGQEQPLCAPERFLRRLCANHRRWCFWAAVGLAGAPALVFGYLLSAQIGAGGFRWALGVLNDAAWPIIGLALAYVAIGVALKILSGR